jgi:hypothetical protein
MNILAAALTLSLLPAPPPAAAPDAPNYERIRTQVQRSPVLQRALTPADLRLLRVEPPSGQPPQRDSVVNGVFIGLGIGVAGGYLWGRNLCTGNDEECLIRAVPAGVLGGAAIGAAAGALIDAFSH